MSLLFASLKWEFITYGFVHDVAIAVYIGGAVAMEFVLGPAQKSIPPAQAQIMGQKTADRFLWLVWGSLLFIILTGFLRLEQMGMIGSDWPFFQGRLDWDLSYGRTIFAMLAIWLVLVINGIIITFILRPRLAGRMSSGVSSAQATRRQDSQISAAQWVERLSRIDLTLLLIAALLGASLKLGGIL
jgi:uncharacterized membrane protein